MRKLVCVCIFPVIWVCVFVHMAWVTKCNEERIDEYVKERGVE